jgi:elongation factor 2
MDDLSKVRNVVMVGAMGSGKTSAIDCLAARCGLIDPKKIGATRLMHCRDDEKEKGCSIKTSVISMVCEGLLLNVVDTPGHAEFGAEFTVAMPLADTALVITDGSATGLAAQTSMQVKELNNNLVNPLLVCNRIDVSFLITQKETSDITDNLFYIVEMFNATLQQYPVPAGTAPQLDPAKGQVVFGSMCNGWAFTVPQMAKMYASKFGVDIDVMAERMYGEKYFNPKKKSFTKDSSEGNVRTFEQFVLNPIKAVADTCASGNIAKLEKMMTSLGVTLQKEDKELEGNALFHRVMSTWLPAGPCITEALEKHALAPNKAQEKRAPVISAGPASDPSCGHVKACNPKNPLLFQIVKMVPQPATPGRFYCIGRVFSGTMSADKCFLLEDGYLPPHAAAEAEPEPVVQAAEGEEAEKAPGSPSGSPEMKPEEPPKSFKGEKKATGTERRAQGILICAGRAFNSTSNVPAGNICAISGVDQYIKKRATLAGSLDQFPCRRVNFTVSPVVRISVEPKVTKELPKMVQGMQRLDKSCPLVEVTTEDSGKHNVAGVGVEHMRVLQRDLEKEFLDGIALTWGAPSVQYRETVTDESNQICLSKSPNKHNRLFVKAQPLDEEVNRAIEANRIYPTQDLKTRTKLLEKEFNWDKTDALKIWGFGPAPEEAGAPAGANLLVDQTKGCQYLNEIKESMNSGLLWAAKEGPLCEENMRGVRFNLLDVKLHADSIHRGMGQIQPTTRRVLYASTMTGTPRLVEPVFMADIEGPATAAPGCLQAISACRGELVQTETVGSRVSVQAYVPIAETIGTTPFATVLSQKTNGSAFVSYKFDHWENMGSDPMAVDKTGKATTKASEIALAIRERKGLKVAPPVLFDYLDKL